LQCNTGTSLFFLSSLPLPEAFFSSNHVFFSPAEKSDVHTIPNPRLDEGRAICFFIEKESGRGWPIGTAAFLRALPALFDDKEFRPGKALATTERKGSM
jgi:hypothetical protein